MSQHPLSTVAKVVVDLKICNSGVVFLVWLVLPGFLVGLFWDYLRDYLSVNL